MNSSRMKIIIGVLVGLTVLIAVYFLVIGRSSDESFVSETETPKIELREAKHEVVSGERLESIFSEFGVKADQGHRLIEAFRELWDPKKCQIGDKIDFSFDDEGDLVKFRYQASLVDIFEANRVEDDYEVEQIDVPVTTEMERISIRLNSSLYQDFISIGEYPALIEKIVDILAWDVDFFSDPRKGDTVSIIVEKKFVDGQFYKYGRIFTLEYAGQIADQLAFYYRDGPKFSGYYDQNGKSLARNFLKTPVKFTRISSKFGMRRHPVTHQLKRHYGTDYAAPVGTPVWAMADGTVIKKAHEKYGGNYVGIKHGKGYETYYLHLSKFEPGIRPGKRVRQKDIVGYVGTTGRSTGPHLHLSIKYGGKHIDPLKIKKIKEKELTGENLEKFKVEIIPAWGELRGRRDLFKPQWL